MSCEKNSARVSAAAGAGNGISPTQGKFTQATGAMMGIAGRSLNTVQASVSQASRTVTGTARQAVTAVQDRAGQVANKAKGAVSATRDKVTETTQAIVNTTTRGLGRGATTTLAIAESFGNQTTRPYETAMSVAIALGAYKDLRDDRIRDAMERRQALERLAEKEERLADREDRAEKENKRVFVSSLRPEEDEEGRLPLVPPRDGKLRRQLQGLLAMAKVGHDLSVYTGNAVGLLSRKGETGVMEAVQQKFFFKSNIPVQTWKSQLTPVFNAKDVIGMGKIQSSHGTLFAVNGKTWHVGTTVVKTGTGERTISHLQSLSVPADHYYFSRPLSDNDAVGIVVGQKGFEPKQMKGYAGSVSSLEGLTPSWSLLKHSMIKAHVWMGDQGGKKP